ncbi:hypothetical protein CEXT_549521 [Caerostris extrusa]|uniref:Uncharacterized protein n=1 Tax=Caerostris extrusa TaxID=172846 RepID=A0AAV4N3J7_CAEEX|nr:hypothetical protein CEXT_549521 [Caerostris extrusa]
MLGIYSDWLLATVNTAFWAFRDKIYPTIELLKLLISLSRIVALSTEKHHLEWLGRFNDLQTRKSPVKSSSHTPAHPYIQLKSSSHTHLSNFLFHLFNSHHNRRLMNLRVAT